MDSSASRRAITPSLGLPVPAMPTLILPSVQVNIRAGALPDPDANGVRYLKLPIDTI